MRPEKKFTAKVITIVADKGGTGKTTTSVNLAASLAKKDKKVLLIDLDEQCNSCFDLGLSLENMKSLENSETFEGGRNAKQLFMDQYADMDSLMIKRPVPELPTLDLIASSFRMMYVERMLIMEREDPETPEALVLLKTFNNNADILNRYDYVIIDTKPSLSFINENALVAAAEGAVLVLTEPSFNSLYGIAVFFSYWDRVKRELDIDVDSDTWIILNRFKANVKMDRAVYAVLKGDLDNEIIPEEMRKESKKVFFNFHEYFIDAPIKETAILRQRSAHKIPIVLYTDAKEKRFLEESWYPLMKQLKRKGVL